MGEAVAALLWALIELLLIVTGKFVVTAVSWGRWRGERLNSKEASIYGPAGALSFKREGQRVITANGLLIAGVLFCAFGIRTVLGGVVGLTMRGSEPAPASAEPVRYPPR